MSFLTKYFPNNNSNNVINWASEESLAILRQLLSNFRALNVLDANQRLKIVGDTWGINSNTLGSDGPSSATQTTLATTQSSTNSAIITSAASAIGSFDASNMDPRYFVVDIMNQAYCSGTRKNLTFS